MGSVMSTRREERRYASWGRYPRLAPGRIVPVYWRADPPEPGALPAPVLAFGQGRSYGDVCLNRGGTLLDTAPLDRFIDFDAEAGRLRCEAGITLAQVLELIVPQGWFLPVTPGTKYVSVGGAIANDVHGKNHHRAGTFGCHVTRFELLRSTGERLVCSPEENDALFRATIGGLGLTGLILWAEFRLKRITGPGIEVDRIRFDSLEAFFALSEASDGTHEYTVAWVDALARGRRLGRGVLLRGNTAAAPVTRPPRRPLRIPFDAPGALLCYPTVKVFNTLYYRAPQAAGRLVHYEPFFYPLDRLHAWNRLYGRRGFLQYQCVIPFGDSHAAVREMLRHVSDAGRASFLAVLKTFGSRPSPGLLSFPRPGVTLALDFPFHPPTLSLLEVLDEIVCEAGGAVYPAKDARMPAARFRSFFPQWEQFAAFVDPAFSSSFWRRVAAPEPSAVPTDQTHLRHGTPSLSSC